MFVLVGCQSTHPKAAGGLHTRDQIPTSLSFTSYWYLSAFPVFLCCWTKHKAPVLYSLACKYLDSLNSRIQEFCQILHSYNIVIINDIPTNTCSAIHWSINQQWPDTASDGISVWRWSVDEAGKRCQQAIWMVCKVSSRYHVMVSCFGRSWSRAIRAINVNTGNSWIFSYFICTRGSFQWVGDVIDNE